jgi:tetratricopeptide (TPR) repeat protein
MLVDQSLRTLGRRRWPAPFDRYAPHERRRRRLRLVLICASGVALVVAGVAVWALSSARSTYLAGERALVAGDYPLAARRFSEAKMIFWPYADARALASSSLALANGQSQELSSLWRPLTPTTETRSLRRAAALFQDGRYAPAQALVGTLHSRVPVGVGRALAARSNTAVAALLLLVGADQAFAARDWSAAAQRAAGVLVLYPRCGPAAALAAETGRRLRAEPLDARASALVAASRWSAARTIVRRALSIDPSYPGAAAMLRRINATLAHRKAAAAAAARAAAAAARVTTPPASTTPVAKTTPPPP